MISRIINWLLGRKSIAWRLKPLEYHTGEGIATCMPKSVCGLHIVVEHGVGVKRTVFLLREDQCLDRKEFWNTWTYLGGAKEGWVDEDGREYRVAE